MQAIAAQILLAGISNDVPAGVEVTSVATDHRKVQPGSLFVAIKGERADGHDFAAEALRAGAALVLGSRPVPGLPPQKLVLVPDVLDAMIAMGANYRAGFSPLVLGVTGSVGKTTTKEFCAAVFGNFGETLKTDGNQNNEIGLPNTLFRLSEDIRYAVIEMGMQGLGEIRKLAQAARPSGAIITKIGLAHIEQLGSIENVLAAKLEIADGLAPGAPLIINGDDERLFNAAAPQGVNVVCAGIENEDCAVRAKNIRREGSGQVFTITDSQFGRIEAYIPALGRHMVQNALLAYTAATRLGLNAHQTAAGLASYQPAGSRQQIQLVRDVTLLKDYYNANPDSMQAALNTLAQLEVQGRRIAVLGDMLELGAVSDEQHRALGRDAKWAGANLLVAVGPGGALAAEEAKRLGMEVHPFASNADAAAFLRKTAQAGDAVLMKASRGMHFEEIFEAFEAE